MPALFNSGTITADGSEQALDTFIEDGIFLLRVDMGNAVSILQEVTLRCQIQVLGGGLKVLELGSFQGGADIAVEVDQMWNYNGSIMSFTLEQTAGTLVDFDWEILREISNQSILNAINGLGAGTSGGLSFFMNADNTVTPIEGSVFVGVPVSGTLEDTETENGIDYVFDDAGNNISVAFETNVSGFRTGTKVIFRGWITGGNDEISLQAYRWDTLVWETLGLLEGQGTGGGGPDNIPLDRPLLQRHTGSGGDIGRVLIRLHTEAPQTNPQLAIDQLLVEAVNTSISVGYQNGAVWINTDGGQPGTVLGVNGTADNPSSNLADAIAIAAAIGLTTFQVVANSELQFLEGHPNETWAGNNWSLDLNGQAIDNIGIDGALINGIGTSASGERPILKLCGIDIAQLPPSVLFNCGVGDSFTCGAVGNYDFLTCYSLAAGPATPNIDLQSLDNISMNIKDWYGGIDFGNVSANDDLVIEGIGGTINVTGAGGNLNFKPRGIFQQVNDLTASQTTIDRQGVVNPTIIREATAAVQRATAITEGFPFEMVLPDNVTPAPGLTITVQRSLDGAVYEAVTGTITEIGFGSYVFLATVADTSCLWGKWLFTAPGAADTRIGFRTFE